MRITKANPGGTTLRLYTVLVLVLLLLQSTGISGVTKRVL